MPWTHKDATRFTKKADTAAKAAHWAEVANGVLERTGEEGKAVQAANSAIKHFGGTKRVHPTTVTARKKGPWD